MDCGAVGRAAGGGDRVLARMGTGMERALNMTDNAQIDDDQAECVND
jgi:hypothetical protein